MNEGVVERPGNPDTVRIIYILYLMLIGFLLLIAVAVWWIVRCVKGLKYLDLKAPYPNYRGWGF